MITPPTQTDFGRARETEQGSGSQLQRRGAVARVFGQPFGRIAWSAVFAGALIALAMQLVIALLGAAIGLAALPAAADEGPSGASVGFAAGLWLLVSSVLSLFVGGYIAARLAATPNGWLHGLTTWALVTLLSILLLSTAIGSLVGAGTGLSQIAQTVGVDDEARRATEASSNRARDLPPNAVVRETSKETAKGTAAGSGTAAFGFLLGAIAAAFAGQIARRHLRRYEPTDIGEFAESPASPRR